MQILRRPATSEKVGLTSFHVIPLVKDGKFPESVGLCPESIGQPAFELKEWLQAEADQRVRPAEPLPNSCMEAR